MPFSDCDTNMCIRDGSLEATVALWGERGVFKAPHYGHVCQAKIRLPVLLFVERF